MADIKHLNLYSEEKSEEERPEFDGNAEFEKMLDKQKDAEDTADDMVNDDTRCGIGCIHGAFLQRFANKKAYVILYGILGTIFMASYTYSTGTITTIEKRFKIPSRNIGKCIC